MRATILPCAVILTKGHNDIHYLTKMSRKTYPWQQVTYLCQSWEIRLEMK